MSPGRSPGCSSARPTTPATGVPTLDCQILPCGTLWLWLDNLVVSIVARCGCGWTTLWFRLWHVVVVVGQPCGFDCGTLWLWLDKYLDPSMALGHLKTGMGRDQGTVRQSADVRDGSPSANSKVASTAISNAMANTQRDRTPVYPCRDQLHAATRRGHSAAAH